jgi:SAM-dependent methyltransferase
MTQSPINVSDFKAFERAAHDEIAEGYRDFFVNVTGYAVEPLLDAASVSTGTSVLDVATGPGMLASRAADRGARPVIGVDLAPRMVAIAASLHPRIDVRQADAENLPFPDGAFNAVLSNFGIGHFPQPERAVSEFAKGFSFVHRLASAEKLWRGILGGTVRTSTGTRRQPADVQDRIRAAFERLVRPYVREGALEIPVAFKIAGGRG